MDFWHICIVSLLGYILGLAAAWDIATGEILNRYPILISCMVLIHLYVNGFTPEHIGWALAGLGCSAIPMLLTALHSDGIGGGDIKLAGAGGFYLGVTPGLIALIISCIVFIAVWLFLRFRKKVTVKTRLKYGPCYAIGALISAVFCF